VCDEMIQVIVTRDESNDSYVPSLPSLPSLSCGWWTQTIKQKYFPNHNSVLTNRQTALHYSVTSMDRENEFKHNRQTRTEPNGRN